MDELAGGKLLLDRPAEAVSRLTISNPERRNALDHEILDALAETLPRLDRGIETRCLLITGAPPVFQASAYLALSAFSLAISRCRSASSALGAHVPHQPFGAFSS